MLDVVTLRIVVGGLAVALITAIVAEAALAALGVNAPAGISQIGSCCVGALSAILSHVLTKAGTAPAAPATPFAPPAPADAPLDHVPHEDLRTK